MKGFAVVTLGAFFAAIVWARPEGEKYTDQYDDINVDEILANARLRDSYFNCLKTGKKCTPAGQLLRDTLPDALQTACSKCTDVQKKQTEKVIDYLLKNNPEHFKELEAQFDPERKYRAKYADEIKARGLVLPD